MTTLADRYELQELLGSGGMAHVHAAVDQRLGRRVAVKLVRADLVADGSSRQRLLREARSAASFHHPNSVAVYDVGEHERQPFIVMELVEGESLFDRLQRERRLDAAEAVRVGVGVLAALQAAHERGLVHRDIKPANVLLPRRGGVKLADFGIAKAVADAAVGLTSAGDVMGTPKYLSPEQAGGHTATPASDLYALGVVLYECLAGKPPFTADNAVAVAMAHQREPVPSLRRAARDVPPELARIVERALAKDPAERFADAAAMRRALEAAGQPGALAPGGAAASAAATTTALSSDVATPNERAAPAAVPADERPARGAPSRQPPPSRPRRKGLGALAVVAALALVGVLVVGVLWRDSGVESPDEGPVDVPLEDEPAEDEPAEDEAPEDELPDEEPPADEPPAEDGA